MAWIFVFQASLISPSTVIFSILNNSLNFTFIGELRNIKKDEVLKSLEPYEDFFHGEIMGKKKYIRDLSKGNQKKVGVVGALICDTPLVVLDEPFANLDPTTQIRLKVLLKDKSKNSDKTFIISSHDLQHVTEVCERIVVLDKGHVVKDVKTSKQIMVAGDIKTNDLTKLKNKPYIIDISGHLESEKGVKDINKIDKFLNTVHNISS